MSTQQKCIDEWFRATRPCPHCTRPIPVNQWPQHVGDRCYLQPESNGRGYVPGGAD